MDKISWKEWFGMLLVIAGVIVAIDIYFGAHFVGATTRFLWNGVAFLTLWFARVIEAGAILLTRRRAIRLTTFVTAIGVGYASSVILTDAQVRKAYTLREKVRLVLTKIRGRWLALPTWGKFVFVGLLIIAQIICLPRIAEWIVLFPIAFMVPVLKAFGQWLALWIADSFIGRMYWMYFGTLHRKITRGAKMIPIAKQVREMILLKRLQYLTAWRMWMHEACYQTARGRRRISLFEPVRLWWRGELNTYVGRPLLSGKSGTWPVRTYVPPKLWYEHDRPVRHLVSTCILMLLAIFSMNGSVRKRA